jgi:hypothetical protein
MCEIKVGSTRVWSCKTFITGRIWHDLAGRKNAILTLKGTVFTWPLISRFRISYYIAWYSPILKKKRLRMSVIWFIRDLFLLEIPPSLNRKRPQFFPRLNIRFGWDLWDSQAWHVYLRLKNFAKISSFISLLPTKSEGTLGLYSVRPSVCPSVREISFPHFCSCFQIFIWYLVHCFAILRYRSSSSLVLIHQFFTELWPLDLEKYHEFSVFRTFFFRAFRYSFGTWYIALPYQDTDQVRVWFWSIDFSQSYGPWT